MPNISFQGLASGIDGSRIAQAVFEQLTLQNLPRKNRISELERENSSLEDLRTKLLALADKVEGFRSSNGGAGGYSVVSSNTAVLTATAGSDALKSSYTVTVESTAKNASGSFNKEFSSKADFVVSDPSETGTVTFTVGEGAEQKTFDVSVGELTTAEGFVHKFNEGAEGAAQAQLVNVGTESNPKYKISFSTTEEGSVNGSIEIVSQNASLLAALGGTEVEQASNAVFSISGFSGSFERESNVINDVISGVTFELKGEGVSTVSLQQSAEATKSQLKGFVEAYNDLVKFVNAEDKVAVSETKDGRVNQYSSLAKSNVDNDALSSLRSVIASVGSADGKISFASLGIQTQKDGTLSFDEKVFEQAFNTNAAAVDEVVTKLADTVGGVSGVISNYTSFGRVIEQAEKSNQSEIRSISDKIASVERHAAEQESVVQRQFSSLEGLIAQLNSQANVLGSLFNFGGSSFR